MKNLEVTVASGDALDIRHFAVQDQMSSIFTVSLTAESRNPSIDFDAVVGKEASFTMHGSQGSRSWHGVCRDFEQVEVEETGLSRYQLAIVPTLWLLTQRRNYRMFQQLSEIEIVQTLLGEWDIKPTMKINAGAYKKRKYKVQYGESDFDFMSRLLEDVGVSFHFSQDGAQTKLVLTDAPHTNEARSPLPYVDQANTRGDRLHVTRVQVHQRVRPGKYTVRDHDTRLPPTYPLKAEASAGSGIESKLERFHYNPGAFLFRSDKGDSTPVADDKGKTRSDEKEGATQAKRRLAAKRSSGKRVTFESNAMDIATGTVVSFTNHPRSDLADGQKHLVLEVGIHGEHDSDWYLSAEAVSADQPYHPPVKTSKPKTQGVESATVVGPPGEEIHTDELGRVRVHFHWDRESKMDDNSSCWIHVNQPWGGAGYGGTNLPRIGQEVLVDFLGGDPDRPVVIGRVYTALQTTPYKLPESKTQSGWKSNSTGNTGGYNELMFEDAQGKELVRMQAEKDYKGLIKNDASTHVGNNRSHTTVGDNNETVQKKENLTVMGARAVTVMETLSHFVQGDMSATSGTGNTFFNTALAFMSQANQHVIESAQCIELRCGASRIVLTPEQIIIDGPLTYLNPGEGK